MATYDHRVLPRFAICLLGLAIGCGDAGAPMPEAPHEGIVAPIPGMKGAIVELVKKDGTAPIDGEVSFFFYKNPFTPLDPQPDTGTFWLDENHQVALQMEDDALTTPAGPLLFKDRQVEGLLVVEIDGSFRKIRFGER